MASGGRRPRCRPSQPPNSSPGSGQVHGHCLDSGHFPLEWDGGQRSTGCQQRPGRVRGLPPSAPGKTAAFRSDVVRSPGLSAQPPDALTVPSGMTPATCPRCFLPLLYLALVSFQRERQGFPGLPFTRSSCPPASVPAGGVLGTQGSGNREPARWLATGRERLGQARPEARDSAKEKHSWPAAARAAWARRLCRRQWKGHPARWPPLARRVESRM